MTLGVFKNFEGTFNGLTFEELRFYQNTSIAALEEFCVLSRLGDYINLTLTANTTDRNSR